MLNDKNFQSFFKDIYLKFLLAHGLSDVLCGSHMIVYPPVEL